jgi:hypothetical protein
MTGAEIFNALLQRGYSPEHAAALGGHILQESGGDPTNVNQKEDAHGLLQWRLDRWKGLQNYAVSRNASPDDPNVQLDYVAREMAGPEAKSGAAFLAAGDLPSASAALKNYIRFGDASADRRLQLGASLLGGQSGGAAARPSAGVVSPASGRGGGNGLPSGDGQPQQSQDDAGLTEALQAIPKQIAASQPEAPQLTPLEIPPPLLTPAMIRAKQMAAAMMSKPLTPPGTLT